MILLDTLVCKNQGITLQSVQKCIYNLYPKIDETLPGTIKSFVENKNHIGPEVNEIFRCIQTHNILLLLYEIFYTLRLGLPIII